MWMLIRLGKSLFKQLNGLASAGVAEPDLAGRNGKVVRRVSPVPIQAADQRNIPKQRTKQFHQVENQRWGRGSRLVVEAQGGLQTNGKNAPMNE
jgi:hypothetical protein